MSISGSRTPLEQITLFSGIPRIVYSFHLIFAITSLPRMKNPKNVVLIVDPQVDFHSGAFGSTATKEDAKNTADFISQNADCIDEIYVTLDTHNVRVIEI